MKYSNRKGYAAILDIVLEVFGDIPIKVIDHEMAEELRDVIMQLPPNRTRSAEWNTLSSKQIIKKKPEKTISARTTNTYLDRISAVFEWAKVRGIITINPFVGLKVMISKKVSEQRKALELDDLQALFNKKHFTQNGERPSRYWIPIIAAYSGMRMEEIALLVKNDLKVITGDFARSQCGRNHLHTLWERLRDREAKRSCTAHCIPWPCYPTLGFNKLNYRDPYVKKEASI